MQWMIKFGGLTVQGSPLIAGHLKVNVPAAHFALDNHGAPFADSIT
jgi:hypothetical protein